MRRDDNATGVSGGAVDGQEGDVLPSDCTPVRAATQPPTEALCGTYIEPHQQLVRIDRAREALAEAATVDEARQIVDMAEAMRVYAKKAKLGLAAQNHAAEIKMLAERRCGELLRDMDKHPPGPDRLQPATDLPPTYADLDIEKTAAHRWQKVAAIPVTEFERYIEQKKAMGEEVTTAGLLSRRDTAALYSSESFEWYTPAVYVDAAWRVMGGIDLDPASCAKANETVQAETYFDKDTDGLSQQWLGRVFCNPPYSGFTGRFVGKLAEEWSAGRVAEAIILVTDATSSGWFQPLWDHLICFTSRRIHFETPTGEVTAGTPNGNAFVYFGPREKWPVFAAEFSAFGAVVVRWAA